MIDMFHNYDNHIDTKEYPKREYQDPPKELSSISTAQVVKNIHGDNIGIRAHKDSVFNIYFLLEGTVENSSIEKLVSDNKVIVQILDKRHNIIYEKEIQNTYDHNLLSFQFDQTVASNCLADIYFIKLILEDSDKNIYTLFSENKSFLSLI